MSRSEMTGDELERRGARGGCVGAALAPLLAIGLACWLLGGSARGAAVVASVGATASVDAQNSITTNAPSGVANGDLLVLFTVRTGSTLVYDTPSGWTQALNASDNFGASRQTVWWKIANGTNDTPTLTRASASTADAHAIILRITGHDPTTPLDATASLGSTSNSTNPPVENITTTVANALLLTGFTTGGANITGGPSTWTQQAITADVSGVSPEIAIYAKTAGAAGSYGGETATLASSTRYTNAALAIKPAAGGGSSLAYPQIIISRLAPQRAWQRFLSFTPTALAK